MATAEGSRSKKPQKRKVTHIRIHKAANGFTVHHEKEPVKTRKAGGAMMPSYEPDPPPSVFTDKQAMLDHVGGLADQMGGPEQGEAAEGGAPQQAA